MARTSITLTRKKPNVCTWWIGKLHQLNAVGTVDSACRCDEILRGDARYTCSYKKTYSVRLVSAQTSLQVQSQTMTNLKVDAESNAKISHESLEKLKLEQNRINEKVAASDERRMKILQRQSSESERRKQVDAKLQEMTSALHDEELAEIKSKNTLSEYDVKKEANTTKMTQCIQNIEKLQNLKNSVSAILHGHKEDKQKITAVLDSLKHKKAKAERDLEDLEIILEKSSKAGTKYDSKIQTVRNFMHEDYSVAKLKEHAPELGILGLVYFWILSLQALHHEVQMSSLAVLHPLVCGALIQKTVFVVSSFCVHQMLQLFR